VHSTVALRQKKAILYSHGHHRLANAADFQMAAAGREKQGRKLMVGVMG